MRMLSGFFFSFGLGLGDIFFINFIGPIGDWRWKFFPVTRRLGPFFAKFVVRRGPAHHRKESQQPKFTSFGNPY